MTVSGVRCRGIGSGGIVPISGEHRERMKALILGGVAWDTMVYLDEFPRTRPHTVFTQGSNEAVGSSGAGKAMNLSRLGVDVTLWALVG